MERLGPRDFHGSRLRHPGAVVACFLADWCGFCREFEPGFRGLDPLDGCSLAVVDLSDMANPLWEAFEIDVVPTLIVFVDGAPAWRRDGVLGEGLGATDLAEVRNRCRPKAADGPPTG